MNRLSDKHKDWEIAREMFAKNTKRECTIVKGLRKDVVIENLCEGWSTIRLQKEEVGWIISNEFLN